MLPNPQITNNINFHYYVSAVVAQISAQGRLKDRPTAPGKFDFVEKIFRPKMFVKIQSLGLEVPISGNKKAKWKL